MRCISKVLPRQREAVSVQEIVFCYITLMITHLCEV